MTRNWSQYCTELTRHCQPLLPKFPVCMFSMRSQGLQSITLRNMVFLATPLHTQAIRLLSYSKLVASWKAYSKTWSPPGLLNRRSVVMCISSCRTTTWPLSVALTRDPIPRIYLNERSLGAFSSGVEVPSIITCLM
jgi:hypothetical protein